MRAVFNVFWLAVVLLILSGPLNSQVVTSGIQFIGSQQISLTHATHPHVESFIAVDSRDPQHLLAASMVVLNGKTRSYPYVSFDGGKSWTLGRMTDDAGVVTEDDPIV